jgi:heme/copper-type cytochrome/quinol oxidase subunit 2
VFFIALHRVRVRPGPDHRRGGQVPEPEDDDGSLPVQVHGNTRLEIFWTVIPALILAGIAVPTVQGIFEQMNEPEDEFLTVQVIGHRWWWEFYYPTGTSTPPTSS